MKLTSYQEIMDAVEKQAVICPNPPFWYEFCTFINDQVPIDFCNGEMRPFILVNWHSTNDFQKNQQFKKQLDYLAMEKKEDLVTIFFGRSITKLPTETAEPREVWYENDSTNWPLDPNELDCYTEMSVEYPQLEQSINEAAKLFELITKKGCKKGHDYGYFELKEDLERLEENQIDEKKLQNNIQIYRKIMRWILGTLFRQKTVYKEMKLIEIYGLYLEQYGLNTGKDLRDFSDSVYETWAEERASL